MYIKETSQEILQELTQNLQVYPYFWLKSRDKAKSRDKLVTFSCYFLYGILGLFPICSQSLLNFYYI